jgi:hypothetical protein
MKFRANSSTMPFELEKVCGTPGGRILLGKVFQFAQFRASGNSKIEHKNARKLGRMI